MNRWEGFQFICATLRVSLAARPLDIPAGVDWHGIIAQAGVHFVTPMKAPALVDHADAPSDVRDYFAAVQTLTAQHAEVLLAQSAEIVSVLRAIDAQPVLLKGAAALAQGLYPAHGVRLMTDIDVLIADTKMKESNDALAMRGYRQQRLRQPLVRPLVPDDPPQGAPHHDPPLVHDDTGVRVELHHALAVPTFAALLPASDALRRATPVSVNGMAFSVLAPTDRVVHHILHAQLNHHGAQSAIVDLRQLVDLAVLVDAFGHEIDWTDVEVRFAVNGHADALADYLAYLVVLLDRRVPAHISDVETVMARLRAGLEVPPPKPKPGETIGTIASEYWQRFRQQPARAINLLDPRFWPGRLGSWRDRLWPRFF